MLPPTCVVLLFTAITGRLFQISQQLQNLNRLTKKFEKKLNGAKNVRLLLTFSKKA